MCRLKLWVKGESSYFSPALPSPQVSWEPPRSRHLLTHSLSFSRRSFSHSCLPTPQSNWWRNGSRRVSRNLFLSKVVRHPPVLSFRLWVRGRCLGWSCCLDVPACPSPCHGPPPLATLPSTVSVCFDRGPWRPHVNHPYTQALFRGNWCQALNSSFFPLFLHYLLLSISILFRILLPGFLHIGKIAPVTIHWDN